MKNKILDIKKLLIKVKSLKTNKKKIVLSHGVFDLVHAGHILHFQESKKLGDILIVSLTADNYVNKGPNRPIFSLRERIESIAQIDCVDYVVSNYSPTSIPMINLIKPNIYSKGLEYKKYSDDLTGNIIKEKKAVKKNGGAINFTKASIFSSSKIINNSSLNLTNSQQNFLSKIKKNGNIKFQKIQREIDSLKKLKILIIGETMVDKYIFCETLGKSGKDSYLALRELNSEKYVGGTLAIAKNLSSFCRKITVLSYLGEKKEEEKFLTKNLDKNINFKFIKKKSSKTIVKTRFVETINNTKLMGAQTLNDKLLNNQQEKQFKNLVDREILKHDIVIVSDYGHGLITDKLAKIIMRKAKFLAVNAQINAANVGFHTISKYKNSNLVIINENELRHEMRDKEKDLNLLLRDLSKKISTDYLAVTSGQEGVRVFDKIKNFIKECPAFTFQVKDKIGAGDTLLALLSPLIFKKFDLDFSMFVASLAAADNVQNIANSKSINKTQILKSLQSYIK